MDAYVCVGLLYAELARTSPRSETTTQMNESHETSSAPPPTKKFCKLFSHSSRQSQPAAQRHAPTPQEQLTNYLDKINHPAFDPDQFLALLLAEKEYEALKPLFRQLFCTPATSALVKRVFSTSGIIMRPHRAHISNSLLETLVSKMQL